MLQEVFLSGLLHVLIRDEHAGVHLFASKRVEVAVAGEVVLDHRLLISKSAF